MGKIYLEHLGYYKGICSFIIVISHKGWLTRLDGAYKIGATKVLVSRQRCNNKATYSSVYPQSRASKLIPVAAIRSMLAKRINREENLSKRFSDITPWF